MKKLMFGIILLLSISFVFAFGVSSPYWDRNPLFMGPGETKDVEFFLVNSPTNEVANVIVELVDGAGIAEIISGTNYTVDPGSSVAVVLRINTPEDAFNGTIYNVKFTASSAISSTIVIRYNIEFPVIIEGGNTEFQIINCKPGNSNGQHKNGISPGTLNVFDNQTGWAKDGECFG